MFEKDDKIGDYNLVKFLGRGQLGEVWLAEKHLQFSTRKVRHALKFLSNLGEEINLKTAEAEVDTWIEAGGHPNVMSVIDMLITDNHIVIISEYAEDGSLTNWLKKYGGKAPNEDQALEMMAGILRGIQHLHSRNVVHRDLKPDNILLQGNFPRITDFGISRIVNEGPMTTKAIGSPAYMSPEAFAGNKSPQSDIWSAGVILYQMLTGKFPYEHETVWGLVNQIHTVKAKPLPEFVSTEGRLVVENALQKDVKKRFQTAHEMLLAVERAIYSLKSNTAQKTIITEKIEPLESARRQVSITNEPKKTDSEILNPLLTDSAKTFVEENQHPVINEKETEQKTYFPPNVAEKANQETQLLPTIITDGIKIEPTIDLATLEREQAKREQAELKKISRQFEEQRDGKKNNNWLFLAAGGGVLSLLLIGGLFWMLSGNSSPAANTMKKDSVNASVNNPPKTETPVAPPGMVYVPGGEFTMGRDDGKLDDEKPAHKVSVPPFFIDIYETTMGEYDEFIKATNYKTPPDGWKDGTLPIKLAKYPVVGVNWEDANAYAKWAGKRLPTEEEWEFAARGSNNYLYPWGNDWKQGNANVYTQAFAEVGKSKGTSPFGIYDMVGNAGEWTASDFKAYPGGKLSDFFVGKSNLKTVRGGSFETLKEFATATYRIGWQTTGAASYNRTGFRCAKDTEK